MLLKQIGVGSGADKGNRFLGFVFKPDQKPVGFNMAFKKSL